MNGTLLRVWLLVTDSLLLLLFIRFPKGRLKTIALALMTVAIVLQGTNLIHWLIWR